jgi:hypothetical protein
MPNHLNFWVHPARNLGLRFVYRASRYLRLMFVYRASRYLRLMFVYRASRYLRLRHLMAPNSNFSADNTAAVAPESTI